MLARKGLPILIASLLTILLMSIPFTGHAVGTVWSIGTQNDSAAEFTGAAGTFTVGTSPVSAFPSRLSGAGTTETIVFNLASVTGDYYLNVVSGDTSQNSTSGMIAMINNVKLTPRWAGSWHFAKWSNGGKNQGVQTMRWAIPASALVAGSNTLQLKVSGAPNAGSPNCAPSDGVTPYFDMDYVSFENSALNYYTPGRVMGSTDYWVDQALLDRMKMVAAAYSQGKVWIDYLLENGIFDSDTEIIEEMHWTASYPDLSWEMVEPGNGVYDEGVIRFWHYMYEQLREHGVRRILAKIQYVPQWASTNPGSAEYAKYPPTNYAYWTDFIQQVAIRFGDVIDDYAIMNEVNTGGFWLGTQAEYEALMILAYDTLKAYDTIDADGDGVACFVAPSSSNEPGQTAQWQEWYTALYPKMDCFHTHDYKWGLKPSMDVIQAIDPNLQYFVSEFGPANWFVDPVAAPEYSSQNSCSVVGYLLKDPTCTVDFITQWMLRGDPDKNCPWPDPNEWYNSGQDPYMLNDGYCDNYNCSLIDIEPPGPPYSNYIITSSGAYLQHWFWLFDWNGNSVPVQMSASNGDWQYEVDAVSFGDRIEVIATDFQGGYIATPKNITFTLTTPWTNVKVDTYDPDDFKSTTTMAGPTITLTASNLALNSTRFVLSNASAAQNAKPGVFITAPTKSATASGNVSIAANAYDDGSVSSVQYRIDPINNGAFTAMTLSGGSYTATWNSASVADGIHAIQVKVTDNTGQTNDVSHVVKVNNGAPPPSPSPSPSAPPPSPSPSVPPPSPSPSSSPGGNVMHVQDIWTCDVNGNPQTVFAKGSTYYWRVKIVDAGGAAVSGASVTTHTTKPGGAGYNVSATTGADGVALFSKKSTGGDPLGTWTIAVTNVTKTGWTYDSGANVKTETTFTMQ